MMVFFTAGGFGFLEFHGTGGSMPAMRTESASFIAHGLVQEGGGGKEEGG